MIQPHKLVKDMIGKNNGTGSQYDFTYDDKYKPITAPTDYFKIMYDKKAKNKRRGQNMNALRPYTKKRKGQNMNEMRGWN